MEVNKSGLRYTQFSLRTAFLCLALAAAGASLWISYQQSRQVAPLSREIKNLRSQLGQLTIEPGDQDKVHAVAIPSVDPMIWKWRLYIPASGQYRIHFIVSGVSDANLPTTGINCGPLQTGEQTMTIALRKNEAAQDQWQWIVQCGNTRTGPILEGRNAAWINRPSNVAATVAAQGQVEVVQRGIPLELLRYRSFPFGSPMTGVGDGILVWIRSD